MRYTRWVPGSVCWVFALNWAPRSEQRSFTACFSTCDVFGKCFEIFGSLLFAFGTVNIRSFILLGKTTFLLDAYGSTRASVSTFRIVYLQNSLLQELAEVSTEVVMTLLHQGKTGHLSGTYVQSPSRHLIKRPSEEKICSAALSISCSPDLFTYEKVETVIFASSLVFLLKGLHDENIQKK